MIARCWLHIGTEKTGTTTIQKYLARNRAALLEQHCLYPRTPAGTHTHLALTAYALDDGKVDSARTALGIDTEIRLASFRNTFPATLERESDSSSASTLLLSNEHLAARLRTKSEMARIKNLCDRIARQTKVIVYLRNQVDFLVADYLQHVVDGGTRDFAFDRAAAADYATLLARWSETFGRDNIIVRRFEKAYFGGGDLLADFADQVGIDAKKLVPISPANTSLDAESIRALRAWNRHFPPAAVPRRNYVRRSFIAILRRRRGGTRFAISEDAAENIQTAFRLSNARVASEFFGSDSSPLFSTPVSVRPLGATKDKGIDLLSILRLAAMLLPGAAYLALTERVFAATHREIDACG